VEIQFAHSMPASVTLDAHTRINVADASWAEEVVVARTEGGRLHARYLLADSRVHVWSAGEHYEIMLEDPRTREFSATATRAGLTTPLPGVVAAVAVEVGQQVAAGDVLMVIEAMKMEHTITAPYDGTVRVIHFARGDRVPEQSELLELTPR